MKSLIILLVATFATASAFSQKAKGNADTTTKSYLAYYCTMHTQYVSNIPAKCPVCGDDMNQRSAKEIMKMEAVKLYTCPMDSVISTKSGKCPKCGMDLAELKPKKSGIK
jgi:ribosomal protein S27AE